MKTKTLKVAIVFFTACALLLPALSAESCQRAVRLEDPCCCSCCEDSEWSLPDESAQEPDCSCGIGERREEEDAPAIVFSYSDSRHQTTPFQPYIEETTTDFEDQLAGLGPSSLSLPSRDQPLYILHLSLLI
jgi:hypothetical protein